MSTATKQTESQNDAKASSYELASDVKGIKHEIELLLLTMPEDYEERLNALQERLYELYGSIEDKLSAMRWVKDTIDAEIAAASARKKSYDEKKSGYLKVEKARKNDLQRLKDRVVYLLETTDGKAKLDGKNISVNERITASITDEVQAYDVLSKEGLAWHKVVLEGEVITSVRARMASLLGEVQAENGEPKPVDTASLIASVMNLSAAIASAKTEYEFASGTDINKFVAKRVKERREERVKLLEAFGGVEPEDMEPEEVQQYERELAYINEELPLDGLEVTITKFPRGF